ncbi:hypothetical protein yc1106_06853 [Curvularia clavata]|uniref:Integral membrane protein n=1 Tax=Curvularia clavata TaxID=95742 RepID=A0A9Q8ZDP5_CURCL|nr:hypothetical protein yc1106_06853 [Curvularia clavata]
MNASATLRASYVRQARTSIIGHLVVALRPRSADQNKLQSIVRVDHIDYRQQCDRERTGQPVLFDVEKDAITKETCVDDRYLGRSDTESIMEWEEDNSIRVRLKKMFTVFPYRDPIYLVAIIFLFGSITLVISALFELLPLLTPASFEEAQEEIAIPITILLGSILFLVAGIFDTFGALNADRGTIGTSKSNPTKVRYRPALVGTPEFRWIPSSEKMWDLTMNSLAFQAGLLVLFGGVIFVFAGIVDFPGIVSQEDPLFSSIVFGPQVVHGLIFFVANAMLAYSEQERWYKPKFTDPDWLSAIFNTIGGLLFMIAGIFMFTRGQYGSQGELQGAIAAMVGSLAFLIGSIVRWYVVLEVW